MMRSNSMLDLLAPLTSAADLPTHPSLAYPFYSKNITEMARIAEETLQRERAYLHRIKRLFTKFRGDEHWAPCGIMEPDFVSTASQRSIRNREQHPPQSRGTAGDGATEGALRPVTENGTDDMIDPNAQAAEPLKILHKHVEAEKENNISSHANVIEKGLNSTEQANQDLDAGTKDLIKDTEEIVQTNDDSVISKSSANLSPSKDAEEVTSKGESSRSQLQEGNDPSKGIADANVEAAKTYKSNLPSPPAEEEEGEMNPTPSSPRQQQQQQLLLQRRVVTRAQTHAKSKTPTPPTSNTPTLFKNATANGAVGIEQKTGEEFVPDVHPFFTIPASAIPNRDMNLPPYQADEIRRQLLLWVQKQEEVVRGAEELCYGLLRADRMRNDVLRWTKAEGHLHEMSDGEDWYDREEWGLEEDLVKGKEEDDDETTATAKKTRHRRADR